MGDNSIYGFSDFTLNEDGELRSYADAYQSDVFTRKAVDFIERHAGEQPYFLFVAYVAPHNAHSDSEQCTGGAQPPARYLGAFRDEALPAGPAFDEEDVSDKPGHVREQPRIRGDLLRKLESAYRCRLESLLAVDDGVESIYRAVESTGELDDTAIAFTSDNGYIEGEHRLAGSKFFPYEEVLRVPLIFRGTGGEPGSVVSAPALNVDLAPTILDLAGARQLADRPLDGYSLLPAIAGEEPPRRDLLFEGYYSNEGTDGRTQRYYAGLRSGDTTYTEYRTGEQELYDLATDPDQLENVAWDPDLAVGKAVLAERLDRLASCAGTLADPVEGRSPCG